MSMVSAALTPRARLLLPARRQGQSGGRVPLSTMLALLMAVFLIVPVLLFAQFRSEQRAEEQLMIGAVRDQTRLIGALVEEEVRRNGLASFGDLDGRLKALASDNMRIKLLFRPASAALSDAFLYVASSEVVAPAHLAAERAALAGMDILSSLATACRVEGGDTFRFASETGGRELVVGVMPVATPEGCWAIVTSYKAGGLLDTAVGRPFWRKPQVQIAFAGYLVMAAVVGFVAFRIRRSFDRLRRTADAIAHGNAREGSDDPSFATAGTFPEMDDTVRTFDTMVGELRKARFEAEYANQSKSRYLASMSHELRTPLNAIIGFSEMIEKQMLGPVGEARYVGYAGDIRTSGTYLLSLINDVLDLAKLEAGRYEIADDRVEVGELLHWASHLLRGQALAHRHTLTCEVSDGLPAVIADERAMRSIVVNLVTNAIKYTPDGGRIEVSAGLDADGGLRVAVADNGIGIAPEDRAKVLEAYGRAGDDMTVSREGTGLGLAIVRHMTELHGGTLELDSTPGRGTTVTVRLPRERLVRNAA